MWNRDRPPYITWQKKFSRTWQKKGQPLDLTVNKTGKAFNQNQHKIASQIKLRIN